jgi:hypothetical protein
MLSFHISNFNEATPEGVVENFCRQLERALFKVHQVQGVGDDISRVAPAHPFA